MMVIDNKYAIRETVYITTDVDQLQRVITSINILPGNELVYVLCCGSTSSEHYEFEISDQINIEIKTNG